MDGNKHTSIFASIFAPPNSSKVLGTDHSLISQTKLLHPWIPNTQHHQDDDDTANIEGQLKESEEMKNKDRMSSTSIYPQQRTQPCQFTSSIYYGGQDIYATTHPHNSYNSQLINTAFKKDGVEDDSEIASRGNWWQGSLYY